MSVAVDNTGQSAGGTSTTSLSISSFAVGAGANRCIYLAVSQYAATDQVPSATFNGSENFVVHDATTIVESPGVRRVTLLKLVNPSNATAAIVVSWGGTVNEVVIGASSWTGVDQTTPFGTAVKNSGASGLSTSVAIPNAVGDVVHDAYSGDAGPAASVTGNQTLRWRAIAGANKSEGAGQSADGTGSNITCTWTNLGVGSGTVFTHIGVAILQATGAAAVPPDAPKLANPMRPTAQRIIGKAALAMRAFRPPQAAFAGATFNDTVAESGTAADSETATADFVVARAETVTAADAETGTADFITARAESLTAAETQTGALTAAVARAETLSAADSSTGTLAASGAVSEALSAADSATGAMAAAVARAESLSATDSQDATVTAGGTSAQAETLTASDSATATVVFAATRTETLAATDTDTATAAVNALIAEVIAAVESASGAWVTSASRAESLTPVDSSTGTTGPTLIIESAQLSLIPDVRTLLLVPDAHALTLVPDARTLALTPDE